MTRREVFSVPERVVGVLHRKGCPLRAVAADAGGVGAGEISSQRRERPTVGHHVVQNHYEDSFLVIAFLLGGDSDHQVAHRTFADQIETGRREFEDHSLEASAFHVDRLESCDPLAQAQNLLRRVVPDLRKHGA